MWPLPLALRPRYDAGTSEEPNLIRSLSISFLVVLATQLACARRIYTPPPPPSFDGHYHRFPTGLQLAVYEDRTAPRTTVAVSYGVGALEDPSGMEGMAHLVEHLTYKGRLGAESTLEARAMALGAADNALTSHEETLYYLDVPHSQLRAALALEAQRLRDPLAAITDAEFAAVREVIRTEMYQTMFADDFRARVMTALPLAFPEHAYGRPLSGSEGSLKRLTLAAARQWAKSYYTPDNVVIAISGPLGADEARQWVEAAFGTLALGGEGPNNPPSQRPPLELPAKLKTPASLKIGIAAVEDRELWWIWPAPGRGTADELSIHGSAAALDASLRSATRRVGGLRFVDAFAWVQDGASFVIARLGLEDSADALAVHAAALSAFNVAGHSGSSMYLADGVAEGLAATAYAELERIALKAPRHVRAHRRSDFAAQWRKELESGLSSNLYEAARSQFTRDQLRPVLLLPAALATPSAARGAEAGHAVSTAELPSDESALRALMNPPRPIEEFTLGNGMRIVTVRRPNLPDVAATLVVRTRPSALEKAPELALLAANQTSGFFGSFRQRIDIDEGALVQRRRFLSDRISGGLEGLSRWLESTEIHSGAHEIFRRIAASVAQTPAVYSAGGLERRARAFLLGLPPVDPADVASRIMSLEASDAQAFRDRTLRPQNTTLILVGDLPPRFSLERILGTAFFGWGPTRGVGEFLGLVTPPAASATVQWPAPQPAPAAPGVFLSHQNGALARVELLVRGPAGAPRQMEAWMVLCALLEQRLLDQLREERGIAYSVSTRFDDLRDTTFLRVSTSVRPEHVPEVVALVRGELAALAAAPVEAERFRQARWEAARWFDSSLFTNSGVAGRLEQLVAFDLPAETLTAQPEALLRTTPERIHGLARALALDGPAIAIAGNASVAEKPLTAAGYKVERVK